MTLQILPEDNGLPLTDFDPSQIFIGREQQLDLFEIYLKRWQRLILDAQPVTTQLTKAPSPNNRIQGLVILLYGRGGFGKSTLLMRYHDIVVQESQNPLFSKIIASDIVDWEFAVVGKRGLFNPLLGQDIDTYEYFRILCSQLAIALSKKPQEFKKFQLALKDVERARKDASGVLDSLQKDNHYASLRTLVGPGAITLIRWIAPRVGQALDNAKVTAKVEEVVGKGAEIGVEQLVQLHAKLQDKLGARLGDYLEPDLRLGLALGEDLYDFAKNCPFLIFFDTYEEIDDGDRLLRVVMGAAGLRVGWVIAGRDNLWAGTEQRERSVTMEYGYRDIVSSERGLSIDFNVGGVGAFTISDIVKYFAWLCEKIRFDPPLAAVTEQEAARILDVTQGVPLAVKIAAGLYTETANLEIVTEKAESKRKIVDQMVRRYLIHAHDNHSERARLYGLALLRRADQPAAIAAALGLTPEQAKTSYTAELSWLHRRYSFIFSEQERPSLHQEVRHFLRLWLLEHRTLPEIKTLNERLKESQETALIKLEATRQFNSLRDRLEDEEWVRLYLDLIEQHFWLDPVEGVEYALPFMLAAAFYCRELNRDVDMIGSFFEKEIPKPYYKRWKCAAQSLIHRTSYNPSREELSSLEELTSVIHQRCPHFPSILLPHDFQKEIEAALYFRLGEAYLRKNGKEALTYFEKALNRLENDDEIRETTALAAGRVALDLFEEEKYNEAKSTLDRAIELDATELYLYQNRGTAYLNLKEYQKAIADFDRAIELNPSYSHAYHGRGDAYASLKEYQKAIADFDRAIELNSTEPIFYYDRGRGYVRLKEDKKAIANFDRAIELNISKSKAIYKDMSKGHFYRHRGHAYANLKEYQQAIADYSSAISNYDHSDKNEAKSYKADTYLDRGQAYANLQEYQQAIADYNSAIKLDSENEHVGYKMKGLALYALQRFQEAVHAFHKALTAVAGCFQCLNSLARSYKSLHSGMYIESVKDEGDYQPVIDYFNHFIQLNPTDIIAIINRGVAYHLVGRDQEALADLNRALKLDPKNRSAILSRSSVFSSSGHHREALADLDNYIVLAKSRKDMIRDSRGLLLGYLGRYDEAVEEYTELLKNEPEDISSLYNIAVAIARSKGLAEAYTYINKARSALLDALNSGGPSIALYGLGGLEALTNDTDQALNHLQEAILTDNSPDNQVTSWARYDAAWRDLRMDSRFQAIISPRE